MKITEGTNDRGEREWDISATMDLPAWIIALGYKHKLIDKGTLNLPEGPHAFWDDLEKGPPHGYYEARLTNQDEPGAGPKDTHDERADR